MKTHHFWHVKAKYTYLVVQLVAILQNTRPDFSELNVGPTVRSARSVKQQSRVAKLDCSLDQPTQSGQFGFSLLMTRNACLHVNSIYKSCLVISCEAEHEVL